MNFISKNFDKLNEKQRGKILKGSIIPRPIAWITTINNEKQVNLAPFSFFNMISNTALVVSIRRDKDNFKDTFNNLMLNKEAVINIASSNLTDKVDLTSKEIPSNESEVNLAGLSLIESEKVEVPGIKEVLVRLEVVLENHLEIKNYDNNEIETDLLILRVKYAHIDEKVYDRKNEYIIFDYLKPISRLDGPNYGVSVKIPNIKREF